MQLNRGLVYGAVAGVAIGGGTLLVLGARSWDQEVAAEEAEPVEQDVDVAKEHADMTWDAELGTESYQRRGGHGAGGWHGGRGSSRWRGSGRGWGGRSWGWGGHGWGRAWGYRGGRWGYWGPSYYGYSCADGFYFCG
jgi:hypothetical protein